MVRDGARPANAAPETALAIQQVWELLAGVYDPEIPGVSVLDLGLVRSVGVEGGRVTVCLTPTFVGCPAVGVMREDIQSRLRAAGTADVTVKTVLYPPWSSDWITEAGREKLKAIGLAPPPRHAGRVEAAWQAPAACPYCDSLETRRVNDFGPTQCRSISVCQSCRQPFEQFKPI